MNSILARIFAFLNAVVGTVIILMGLILGIAFIADTLPEDLPPLFTSIAFLAIIVGAILFAVVLCGMVAILAEIERHLREIKNSPYSPLTAAGRNNSPKL